MNRRDFIKKLGIWTGVGTVAISAVPLLKKVKPEPIPPVDIESNGGFQVGNHYHLLREEPMEFDGNGNWTFYERKQ